MKLTALLLECERYKRVSHVNHKGIDACIPSLHHRNHFDPPSSIRLPRIMPTLEQISYSREATIAAFNDYYDFLTKMYLPEDFVKTPPVEEGYWPSITKEKLNLLVKNNEVFELMRRLPYLYHESYLVAYTKAAEWPYLLEEPISSQKEIEELRIFTEGLDWPNIPPSAFAFTISSENDAVCILDTRFGLVYWLDPPNFEDGPIREPFLDKELLEICTPESEHEWRNHPAWAIADFFEVMKNEFRLLRSVPIDESDILRWNDDDIQNEPGVLAYLVRRTYQMYGWPDLAVYEKESCQEAVNRLVKSWQNEWTMACRVSS